MKQEFRMGQFLKERYIENYTLLNQTYLRKQVNIFHQISLTFSCSEKFEKLDMLDIMTMYYASLNTKICQANFGK